jgi:hypothetical protein
VVRQEQEADGRKDEIFHFSFINGHFPFMNEGITAMNYEVRPDLTSPP